MYIVAYMINGKWFFMLFGENANTEEDQALARQEALTCYDKLTKDPSGGTYLGRAMPAENVVYFEQIIPD